MTTFELSPSEWAGEYFECAIERIDALLGEGYARANPSLIGSFMQAAAAAMQADEMAKGARGLTAAVSECADQIGRWSEDCAFEASPAAPPVKPNLSVVSKLRPENPP